MMGQTVGYIEINERKTLVLFRTQKYSRQLKLRQSGRDGIRLSDEEAYLRENPADYKQLLDGVVIEL